MRYLRVVALVGICLVSASYAHAQRVVVGFGVGPAYVGPAPECAYGYYGYYPYACAPYGYYGPGWFSDGFFVGAGPWFRGSYGRFGFYGRPGFRPDFDDRGHGYSGRGNFRGDYARGGYAGGGFRGEGGSHRGDFRSFRGGDSHGGGFHGGGSHGGGSHGGGHR